MKRSTTTTILAIALTTSPITALSKVSQAEADKLGGPELTPVGAERSGNADGTIPEWTGGITETPANVTYKVGDFHPDPFADEQPLFTITPDNYQQYSDKLSPGQQAMFEKYPTFKMDVYPTHRTAGFPDFVYEAYKYNAVNAEAVDDSDLPGGKPNGVSPKNAYMTSPFPIPKTGAEVILNHTFRYNGLGLHEMANQLVVTERGEFILAEIEWQGTHYYMDPNLTPEEIFENNVRVKIFQFAQAPARIAGGVLVGEIPVFPSFTKAWSYNPGQRRVRRAPQIAYDNPGTGSDGLRFTDNLSGFSGALDRYSWDLQGKKEMYVPYNAYKLHSDKIKYTDIVRQFHINQDLARYELHRVWVVDAHVREGTSHALARRTKYVDEDSWNILLADLYDKRKTLWRHQEEHQIQYWEVPTLGQTMEMVYDLQSGRYICMGADNESGLAPDRTWYKEQRYYSPNSLKGKAKR